MGFFETVLIGLQFKRLQKPVVFFMMLINFVFFFLFGSAIVFASLEGIFTGKSITASGALLATSIIPFGICLVCANLLKKCVQ